MKYIDAEKLIAEIERRIKEIKPQNGQGVVLCEQITKQLQSLLSFINSLPQEKPSEDLEKAADNYSRNLDYYHYTSDDPAVAFKAGAEWQKNKMLEGAVDCQVVGKEKDLRLIDSTQRCLFTAKRGDWLKIIIVKEDAK